MAKKKKKATAVQAPLKDKNYLLSGRARSLPITRCLVNVGWAEDGIADIFVVREHANKHVTVGVYLVDLFCAGLKNTFYFFNVPPHEFEERMQLVDFEQEECSYELAHNIIYGGIAYAQDYGIEPHPEFKVTQHILEEDTEDVELIEIEFGKNGQPHLVISPNGDPRAEYYMRQLDRYAGPGNYTLVDGRLADFDSLYDNVDDFTAWQAADWDYYIDHTSPEDMEKQLDAAVYMFDKLMIEPKRAAKLLASETKIAGFTISFDPEPVDFSEEEREEVKQLIEILDEGELDLLEKARERILKDISKWPDSSYFHQLLISVYMELKDSKSAYAATLEYHRKFPDELKSKVLYANILLGEGKTAEVLEVFGGHYTLQGLYPDREVFYITEIIDLNIIMAEYFLKIKDLQQARIYVQMLEQIDVDNTAVPDFEILYEIDLAIAEEMKGTLREAQQSEEKKQELIAKLVK